MNSCEVSIAIGKSGNRDRLQRSDAAQQVSGKSVGVHGVPFRLAGKDSAAPAVARLRPLALAPADTAAIEIEWDFTHSEYQNRERLLSPIMVKLSTDGAEMVVSDLNNRNWPAAALRLTEGIDAGGWT